MMILDDCLAYPADHFAAERSMKRSLAWADRCNRHWIATGQNDERQKHSALFGIVQGSIYGDLRRESAERLGAMDFPGYAIGGLAVGEPKPLMYEIIEQVEPYLPEEKPRYLMGVGTPADLAEGVARGVDMKEADRDDAIIVAITRDGKFYLGQNQVNIDDLASKVNDQLANRLEKKVFVKSDNRAKYGDVVQVVDNIRNAGVDQVGLLTERLDDQVRR